MIISALYFGPAGPGAIGGMGLTGAASSTIAMAGVGLGTSLATLKGLGIKPFFVGLFSATMVGVTSLILVLILGSYVRL